MNWEAIGASAEAVAAAAVVISIVYLAAQVRQTKVQLLAQAEDHITARSFEAYTPVYEGNNAYIFRTGLTDPARLDDDQAFVFMLLMDRQRGAFSTIVRRKQNGSISNELAERLLQSYRGLFVETAGGRHWLAEKAGSLSTPERRALNLN